ncbi:MAG: T9SS type A sorting domain-containing protein [Bacteroidales bacterium]|nr:T9SS type A sorting domain-containing protein [Bacteroidales bacterium]
MLQSEEWETDNKENKNIVNNKTGSTTNFVFNENITIYPNPSDGIYTVNLNTQNSNLKTKITITDLTGEIVYSENYIDNNEITINISTEKSGIYFLKFISDNKIIIKKIIKL